MKKLKCVSICCFQLLSGYSAYCQTTDPSPYCTGGYQIGDVNGSFAPYISEMKIGTLDNNPGNNLLPAPYYLYYNNVPAPELTKGGSYSLDIAHNVSTNGPSYLAAFIDFNQNGTFESNEVVLLNNIINIGGEISSPSTATVTIPETAVAGVTRMRVLMVYDGPEPNDSVACTDWNGPTALWGETQDYNVKIVEHSSSVINTKSGELASIAYPNPSNGHFNIDPSFNGCNYTAYDMQGRMAQTGTIQNGTVNLASVSAGQYIVRFTNDKNAYSQIVTIENR